MGRGKLEKLRQRLGFERAQRPPRMPLFLALLTGPRDKNSSEIEGKIQGFGDGFDDGFDVTIDLHASLRSIDPAVPNGVRFIVSFAPLLNKFRIAPVDYAPSTADVSAMMPGLMIETEMSPDAERELFTGERHRVLSEMQQRWPVFEARHNRFIVIVPQMIHDVDGCEAIVWDLVDYARIFQN